MPREADEKAPWQGIRGTAIKIQITGTQDASRFSVAGNMLDLCVLFLDHEVALTVDVVGGDDHAFDIPA